MRTFAQKFLILALQRYALEKRVLYQWLVQEGLLDILLPKYFVEILGGSLTSQMSIDASVDFTSEIYFPHWIYKRLELNEELGLLGLLNEGDENNARKMIIVSLWCIQTDPSNRPSMSRLVEMSEVPTLCKSPPNLTCLLPQDHY